VYVYHLVNSSYSSSRHVRLDDSLALLRLYAQAAHPRFDAAAVRWLGRLMAEHPGMGLDRATLALDAVRGLAGASPEVARSRLALILRQIGEEKSARVLERIAHRLCDGDGPWEIRVRRCRRRPSRRCVATVGGTSPAA
jgi:hypothetical protein